MLSPLNYEVHGKIPKKRLRVTNEMEVIFRFSPTEKTNLTVTVKKEKQRSSTVFWKQKSIRCMEDLVNIFLKPGDLVANFSSGTFAAAKVCPDLKCHRLFLGGRVDTDCFT